MTRQQIQSDGNEIAGETENTPGDLSRFMRDRLTNIAADEIARKIDCYQDFSQNEVLAYQSEYCASQLIRVTEVFWADTGGTYQKLAEVDRERMTSIDRLWRDQTIGTPQYFVTDGSNRIRLYPTPDTSSAIYSYTDIVIGSGANTNQITSAGRPFTTGDIGRKLVFTAGTGFTLTVRRIMTVSGSTATLDGAAGTASSTGGTATLTYGGLLAEGFGVPGTSWSSQSSECPLPTRVHPAVMWRYAALRVGQFMELATTPFELKKKQGKLAWIDSEYKNALDDFEAEAVTMTLNQRQSGRWSFI